MEPMANDRRDPCPGREVSRRDVVEAMLRLGVVLPPFGGRLLITVRPLSAPSPGNALELQPFLAEVRRVVEAMAYLGEPLSEAERTRLEAAANLGDEARALTEIQGILDPRCLLSIRINPESRVSAERGAAAARLVEQGWRAYLIKVRNEAGVTAALGVESPQARPVYRPGTNLAMAPASVLPADIRDRWLVAESFNDKPMEPTLSGLAVEYRIVQLYSRDRGRREAQLGGSLGSGTEDIGFRSRTSVLFDVAPSHPVTLRVRDDQGRACMASFLIRDPIGRVYPARSKRLAPDFFFQDQVYRADGEEIRLPAGEFSVTCGRGPEYLPETRSVRLGDSLSGRSLDFALRRWIDPSALGWYSGDHHIHAAGCSHYESPTEGVRPEDMMRHVLGEALSVGAVLNWGPSYYHQRQYFEAKDNKVSTASTLLRYDLEVSGFPSSFCGHLVLLRLREQDYPEVRQIDDWPSWDLPILKWARAQGAVTGFAHSGLGLMLQGSSELPNYAVPQFNGIGANEYIVDVTHDVVDFISAADTPYPSELNIWYHTLNAGFRTRISGETDFPCMTDDRVGGGRSYVHLPRGLSYDGWCDGVREGRCYVSDGFSHLLDLTANGLALGTGGSELRLAAPGVVKLTARAGCLLAETPPPAKPDPYKQPFWTPEHARVPGTREVTVELVQNGRSVATQSVLADGRLRDVAFEARVERSGWLALRILGSAHTNPIFVLVGGRPIRASRRSVEWCLKAVDQCWSQKSPRMRARERDAGQRAYEHARARYRQILAESEVE